ncbi:MAG: hypothetical protein KDK12_18245 [Rhodobacteraceae bacterium]|nr:hypothetical protein [Paracoccaceae bacterium]
MTRTPCPPSLDPARPQAAGPKERAKLEARVRAGETLKSDDFAAYGSLEVRDALRVMHHGKCAYCESKIAGTQDTDVEHYRPKGGVSEADEAGIAHPGYWWLAMVWENLVLSCQHCNQTRSNHQIVPDGLATYEELLEALQRAPRTRAGKLDAFPTEDNTWVTLVDGDLATEKPLILNPADVDPDLHLEWVLFEGAATVRARNGSPVGEATRHILGLNRRWLEEDRRIHLLEMRRDRDDVIFAINNWLVAPDPTAADPWRQAADRAIARLTRRTEDDRPFAGMARAFLAIVQAEVEAMQPA